VVIVFLHPVEHGRAFQRRLIAKSIVFIVRRQK
jgi:hypothetical protein